jgi:hypothetical protein
MRTRIAVISLVLGSTAATAFAQWTDPGLVGVPVRAVHLMEIRDTLRNQVLPNVDANCLPWTDHPIISGATPIRAIHVGEIRQCIDRILDREPPPVPGQGDFRIQDVRRYQALDDVAHWIEFDVLSRTTIERLELNVRVYAGGVFVECTICTLRDLDPGELQEETVIPSVHGLKVQWTHVDILPPDDYSCEGCGRYLFSDVSVSRAQPIDALEVQASRQLREATERQP